MWGLPFTVTCPSADVTVRCCTARLYQLSARNLETNVTNRVAYHSLFRFYAVHVYASFVLRPVCPIMFQQPSACPVCHSTDGTVCSVCQTQTGQADWPFSLSRLARLSRHVLGRPVCSVERLVPQTNSSYWRRTWDRHSISTGDSIMRHLGHFISLLISALLLWKWCDYQGLMA